MRKKFLIIGLICLFIARTSYAKNPDRIHNYFAQTFASMNVICFGIWGYLKSKELFGGDEK